MRPLFRGLFAAQMSKNAERTDKNHPFTCHTGESRYPEGSYIWMPFFNGMTP